MQTPKRLRSSLELAPRNVELPKMRVAVIHDWLYTFGGAERVLRSILRCVPEADVFTLFDVLSAEDRRAIGFAKAKTSFLQKMPGIAKRHRLYLPLMPLAIEQFDLTEYDLVISSSCAVAKGVITGPDQLHLSYVHSPMRYAWDLQHQYLAEARLTRGVKGMMARILLQAMRVWDSRTSNGVDAYIVNSHFVGRRVQKIYGRPSRVIYPPVTLAPTVTLTPQVRNDAPRRHFLTASRLVSYKNVRAIVDAFKLLPDQQLIVAGSGPELARLTAVAGPNVKVMGFVSDDELRRLMGEAQAFIFAAEEDFGITPLEAQSEGTPVIALGRGGARETIPVDGAAPTGLFFAKPTPDAIAEAVGEFIRRADEFTPAACHANAARFSEDRFEAEFSAFVSERFAEFQAGLRRGYAKSERPRSVAFAAGL